MAYKALYRKYRPASFSEVVGQRSIVTTLQNAIKNNRLAHAYLFCGPRGTGKTSIAKLLAKTINCEEDNKPCGKCSHCLDIQNSTCPDVVELDAASNNGVDEVREIIDKVKYAPLNSKYKVYIIDEIHMMTSSAFNALLKTLEEPPEYCIFILATTEPYKVLPTIISRCQRFDFQRIANKDIETKLKAICDEEKIECDDDAIELIADLAEGALRDALSILDQCIAYSDKKITITDVSNVYGVATKKEKLELFKFVSQNDTASVASKINDLSIRGIDIQRLTIDLINIIKDAVVYDYARKVEPLTVLNKKDAELLLTYFSSNQLLKCIDNLVEAQSKYYYGTNASVYFEVSLLKMMEKEETVEVPKEIVKEQSKPTITNKADTIKKYDDEQLYQILLKANKEEKKSDSDTLAKLATNSKLIEDTPIIEQVLKAVVMASSNDSLIITVETRNIANEINSITNKELIEKTLKKEANINKEIIAVTSDETVFLINYFKARRGKEDKPAVVIKEEVIDDRKKKVEALFGKDGFDIVKE